MKHVQHELTYDGASIEQVTAMLADPAFRERVCEFQRTLSHTVTVTPQGSGMTVVIDRRQSAAGVPSFAHRFIGDTIQILQEERWSSPTQGSLEMSIPGKPGDIQGTVALAETGSGVTETVALDVKVGIPLVGGKLEGLIADLVSKALRAENQVGRQWLTELG